MRLNNDAEAAAPQGPHHRKSRKLPALQPRRRSLQHTRTNQITLALLAAAMDAKFSLSSNARCKMQAESASSTISPRGMPARPRDNSEHDRCGGEPADLEGAEAALSQPPERSPCQM
jgi:hypothetical protein